MGDKKLKYEILPDSPKWVVELTPASGDDFYERGSYPDVMSCTPRTYLQGLSGSRPLQGSASADGVNFIKLTNRRSLAQEFGTQEEAAAAGVMYTESVVKSVVKRVNEHAEDEKGEVEVEHWDSWCDFLEHANSVGDIVGDEEEYRENVRVAKVAQRASVDVTQGHVHVYAVAAAGVDTPLYHQSRFGKFFTEFGESYVGLTSNDEAYVEQDSLRSDLLDNLPPTVPYKSWAGTSNEWVYKELGIDTTEDGKAGDMLISFVDGSFTKGYRVDIGLGGGRFIQGVVDHCLTDAASGDFVIQVSKRDDPGRVNDYNFKDDVSIPIHVSEESIALMAKHGWEYDPMRENLVSVSAFEAPVRGKLVDQIRDYQKGYVKDNRGYLAYRENDAADKGRKLSETGRAHAVAM